MLLTGVYQLPFGKGRSFMGGGEVKDAFLGGWDLTTVTLLETGPRLTPSISAGGCQVQANSDGSCPETATGQQQTNDQSNTNVANRGAVLRPDTVSTNFYAGQSRSQFFNLAAFSPTPVGSGRFGNAGVGILQGPGTAAVSLGVAKSFRITENVHARFESTFTNVLNHTNFAPPATVVDSPSTFGAFDRSPDCRERRQPHGASRCSSGLLRRRRREAEPVVSSWAGVARFDSGPACTKPKINRYSIAPPTRKVRTPIIGACPA